MMDEDACLSELTNPMPSSAVSAESGISVVCDKVCFILFFLTAGDEVVDKLVTWDRSYVQYV